MEYTVLIIAALLAIFTVAMWIRMTIHTHAKDKGQDQQLTLLQNQMISSVQQTGQQIEHLRASIQDISQQTITTLQTTRKSVDDRLDNTSRVIQGVSKQLGQMDEAAKRIFDIGKDVSSLQEALRSPKLRGQLGELFLGELLAQILPGHHYEMQFAFKGGQTVDAIIRLQSGMVPVDSKFPLENFKRMVAPSNEVDRKAAKKLFIKDVKIHIEAIASKYIRTDEGTFDFALMYIPAENVYYETIIKDEDDDQDMVLFNFALKKRVIPVSPNSLYAYLQTILLGLKGMRVEESARDIINNLGRLQKEFDKFHEAFRLVGQHLDNSVKKYSDAENRFGRLEGKMENIEGMVQGLDMKEHEQKNKHTPESVG